MPTEVQKLLKAGKILAAKRRARKEAKPQQARAPMKAPPGAK